MKNNENVARLLKDVWYSDGIVASAAFNLRPQIHETYISVLRESVNTFNKDITLVCKNLPAYYAIMNVAEIKSLKVKTLDDDIEFDVRAVDNEKIKSHAGIFININGQKLVGGEPFEYLKMQQGMSSDVVLLEIRKTLAKLSSKNIKRTI
ncbi:MAG: hypothetical protein K6F33_12565 [Bacteroidales bacterium]|nr:hypothetical protein [Bacteroidales bacterium]